MHREVGRQTPRGCSTCIARRVVTVVLAFAVSSAMACGGLDGLTGGVPDSGLPIDAASIDADTGGGNRPDAGTTETGFDATSGSDAHPDASNAADATDDGFDPACPPFAVFCDDFELGNLSRWNGTIDNCDGSAIGVQDASVPPPPFRGAFGLQAVVEETGGSGGCGAQATAVFPAAPSPGTLAVRVYINGATLQPGANADFMWVRPYTSYSSAAAIYYGPTGFSTAVSSNSGGNRAQNSTVTAPSGWFCLEWDIDYAPNGGRQRVFVDQNRGNGLELVIDEGDDDFNDESATWNALDLGVVSGGVILSSVDLRYDDVAVATFSGAAAPDAPPRIGCE